MTNRLSTILTSDVKAPCNNNKVFAATSFLLGAVFSMALFPFVRFRGFDRETVLMADIFGVFVGVCHRPRRCFCVFSSLLFSSLFLLCARARARTKNNFGKEFTKNQNLFSFFSLSLLFRVLQYFKVLYPKP